MSQSTATYRGHVLVAKAANGSAQCWAWKDGKAPFKETAPTLEQAERQARDAIDAALGPAQGAGDVAVAAYIHALNAIAPISEGQRKMLVAHYRAPDRTITATQLAKAAGYTDYRGANVQYGALGKLIHEQHPVELPRRADQSLVYTFSIADPDAVDIGRALNEEEDAHWRWPMRAAVAEALVAVRLVKA
ncbi:hypothetical protein AWB79_04296 [Caballeronia hypogeia]|uniref:Uncharacterized protein n=2 Tax=Caballeronia hypogeia TaxID=1777140 RepID=A0A158BW82_9BURK|nr:hypothetical protein AWB79_04296 [Caballeronia hypogeia]